MNQQETLAALVAHVKAAVLPHLGTWRSRKVTGIAASGDATFDIDEIAEKAVEEFILNHALPLAYYSEDRGLVRPLADMNTEGLLIIDPIDGTRGAIAGFEACVVSAAWTDYIPKPTLSDVKYAAITEIKGDLTFTAERGQGAHIVDSYGKTKQITLSPTASLTDMAWTLEVVGAPLELVFNVVADLANPTTVRGGFFILNSSAYELTRLLTGQLAGIVDVRTRLLRTFPKTREKFRECGGGRLLSLYGYDVAAAALIALEAGCIVTDAWGNSLMGWNLLDTSESNFGSLIAASNSTLHNQIMQSVEHGFEKMAGEAFSRN